MFNKKNSKDEGDGVVRSTIYQAKRTHDKSSPIRVVLVTSTGYEPGWRLGGVINKSADERYATLVLKKPRGFGLLPPREVVVPNVDFSQDVKRMDYIENHLTGDGFIPNGLWFVNQDFFGNNGDSFNRVQNPSADFSLHGAKQRDRLKKINYELNVENAQTTQQKEELLYERAKNIKKHLKVLGFSGGMQNDNYKR